MLDLAARAALRAAGDAEPNPLVGCVLTNGAGAIIGVGHHRRFGGPHAEIEALRDAERRGNSPRGATAWVTLEPCRGTGKTGPCTDALLRAGVSRVVYASADPAPKGVGGADALRAAGLTVRLSDASPLASFLAQPHLKRSAAGMPWIIAKWAQTREGRFVADSGRWISCPASLRRVHRLRARVDMIITGVGSVLADDPLLTARNVPRVRRLARRVIFDTQLRTPLDAALVRSARDVPLTILAGGSALSTRADHAASLRAAGAEIIETPLGASVRLDAAAALGLLNARYAPANILLETGPGLLQEFLALRLADEAWAFIGGEAGAAHTPASIADEHGYRLLAARRSGVDALLIYGVPETPAPNPSGVSSAGHSPGA